MRKELENKLFQKYPKIFVGKDRPITQNLMGFGFECGDGWFWLIDNLCSQIQWKIDHPSWVDGTPKKIDQVIVVQVKEKFGGLCFYVEGTSSEIHEIIHFAESLSYSICEECGSTKNVGRTTGWIKTICEECSKTENFEDREWIKNDLYELDKNLDI